MVATWTRATGYMEQSPDFFSLGRTGLRNTPQPDTSLSDLQGKGCDTFTALTGSTPEREWGHNPLQEQLHLKGSSLEINVTLTYMPIVQHRTARCCTGMRPGVVFPSCRRGIFREA
jgi:hypothetical protein